jgi:DNA-directed RNA polymerase specialized sigma24 family protein
MNVDAEDLAQSLAAAYLARRHAVAEPGPWLERVARNLAVDAWRRQRREPLASPSLPEACTEPAVWEGLVAEQERRAIEVACRALPSDERALLAQRFGEAAVDGAEEPRPRSATERTRLRRVLLRLREELASLRALLAPGSWGGAGQGLAALGVGGQLAVVAMLGSFGVSGLDGAGLSPRSPGHASCGRVVVAQRGTASALPTRAQGTASPARLAANAPGRPAVSAPPRPTRSQAPTAPESASSPSPSASPVPAQHLDFDGDTVEGELQNPDATFVRGLTGEKKPSLIELRRDFVPELLKGLEDVG